MIEVIPAIDILEGKCVRLEQGNYRLKKVYEADPVEAARKFEDHGIKRLHVVDLDGARTKHVVNWKTVEQIANQTSLIMDFGGGIRKTGDLNIVYKCGVAMAVIGSVAVTDKELFREWLAIYGPQKLILGADVRDRKIAVSGWDDITDIALLPFLDEYIKAGVQQVLCTDISRDGMLQGPSVEMYREVMDSFPGVHLIASGGISSVKDLHVLQESGIPGVVIGKALYENKIKLSELKQFI
ncbi:MAG: 1-(5-phosphoribosyl)-5-[(5-phosphoribosylamino)methylideneamino]imidazole-4-carboxamide isomerase [Bacteroidales bacterium]|nr:1-(5-phosphoribosyl)-5-[(5-phosphoribosylamino)methylideneamino]imidazole-4-carboxamide isomerase [Bacteroidales bacterium]